LGLSNIYVGDLEEMRDSAARVIEKLSDAGMFIGSYNRFCFFVSLGFFNISLIRIRFLNGDFEGLLEGLGDFEGLSDGIKDELSDGP